MLPASRARFLGTSLNQRLVHCRRPKIRPTSNARHLRDAIRGLCTVDAYPTSHAPPQYHEPQNLSRARPLGRGTVGMGDGSDADSHALVKRVRPSRVTDLYNSLVYEEEGSRMRGEFRRVFVMDKHGGVLDQEVNERIRVCLQDYRQLGHAEGAMEVLNDMKKEGYVPSVRAIIMVIEACLPAEEFELAEEALQRLKEVPRKSAGWNKRLYASARTLVAYAYTTKGRYEESLRLMGLGGFREVEWGRKGEVSRVLEGLELGNDSVGWGVLVKSLSKLGMAEAAIEVVDVGMGLGLGMTDALLHMTIDALRLAGKGNQAEWLFDKAVVKGIVPSERTIGSMLMAKVWERKAGSVEVGRIEELVDMIKEPSARFLGTVLNVFAHIGMLRRAEEAFDKIRKLEGLGEGEYMRIMRAYVNYVKVGWESEDNGREVVGMYDEVNGKVDKCWESYMEEFGKYAAHSRESKEMRPKILSNYLRAKLHCFRIEESVTLLEDLAAGKLEWFDVQKLHVVTVLGGIEISCDVKQMERVLELMEKVRMTHDVRTVAFCVGTLLRDGDLNGALQLLRTEGEKALRATEKDEGFQQYHLLLLKKRLDILEMGFKDSGIREVKDLSNFSRRVEGKWRSFKDKGTGTE